MADATQREKLEAMRGRLLAERRKVIEAMAEAGLMPPKNLLGYLADLDSASATVEAILDQWAEPKTVAPDAR